MPPGGGYGGAAPPGGAAALSGVDPFLSGVAQNLGQSYLARTNAYVQAKMGFLSGGTMQYLFAVDPAYVRAKLAMLAAPFLRGHTYARVPEQLSGGHRYVPPAADANAPDLYVPAMALWTYCLLVSAGALAGAGARPFTPELVYNAVSSATGAWALHAFLVKLLLWVLGLGAVAPPLLELAAYAGYAFVYACAALAARLALGPGGPAYVAWAYAALCSAVFLVRSLKRVIFDEARHYGAPARANYLLLALALFQFPFLLWLQFPFLHV
jgi:hypothetical protein